MIKIMKVKGMHCKSCGMLITDNLKEFDGVNKVEVSLDKEIVKVDFDEKKINEGTIKEVIERDGYKVLKNDKGV